MQDGFFLSKKPLERVLSVYSNWRTATAAGNSGDLKEAAARLIALGSAIGESELEAGNAALALSVFFMGLRSLPAYSYCAPGKGNSRQIVEEMVVVSQVSKSNPGAPGDGCIVPELETERRRFDLAIKQFSGKVVLLVKNASYLLPAELEGQLV